MRNCLIACFFASIIGIAFSQRPNQVVVHNGFSTGQDYLDLPEAERRWYAVGVVNGMLLAPALGAPKGKMIWFENCVEGMSDKQVSEILYQYVRSHPAEWHIGLNFLSNSAFADACPDSPSKHRGTR